MPYISLCCVGGARQMVFTYLPRDLVIPYLDLEPKVVYKTESIWASLKNEKSLFCKIWSDSEKGIA